MNSKILLVSFSLYACWVLPCLANTTCQDALTEIKSLLVGERGQRFNVNEDICSGCHGRPGKSGATGPPGPPGPPGEKGTCSCDLTNIAVQLRELQDNQKQWIQIDLLVPRKIAGVVTRGRANVDQWVTTYHVSYGSDLTQMTYYAESHEPKVFLGNSDRNSKVENMFNVSIVARYVRIHPIGYYGHMSLRIELRQC